MVQFKQYFQEHIGEFKRDLRGLIEIPSVTGDRERNSQALKYCLALAEQYGLKTLVHAEGRVGVVELGEGQETLGVLVHVDVVAADESEWSFPSFMLTENEGRLYGRGVSDDKGAVIMIIYVLKYLAEQDFSGNKRVQLVIGTQEEGSWEDIDAYREEVPVPDYGFTPDGEFPITNAEKGYIDIVLRFGTKSLTALKGGNAPNTVPSSMCASGAGNEYRYTGKAAHSSVPELGENAIIKGAKELCEIFEEDVFKFTTDIFGSDNNGRMLGIYKENYVNGSCLNVTTIIPTLVSLENGSVYLNLNARTAYGTANADVLRTLEAKSAGYGFVIHQVINSMEPIYVDHRLEFLQLMMETYNSKMAEISDFKLAFGTSYAKALPNFVSFGPVFPGEPETAHQADEHLSEEKIVMAADIYAEYISAVLKSEKSFKPEKF